MAVKQSSIVKYPYPATLNVGNFVSIKLTNNNFLLWKTQMMGLIESQNMIGFIDGGFPMPNKDIVISSSAEDAGESVVKQINPEFISWKTSDSLLRGWISGTLSEEVLRLVVGLTTSAEVWKALLDAFAQDSRKRVLLTAAPPISSIGRAVNDRDKVFGVLKGLGSGYEAFVTTMLKPPTPTYRELIPLLQGHETMKLIHGANELGISSQNSAFLSQQRSQGSRNSWSNQKGKQQNGSSYKAKHSTQGNQNNWQKKGYSNGQGNQSQQRITKTNDVCQICNKAGHTAFDCWHRFNQAYQREALAAIKLDEIQDPSWFPDTGATSHMTSNVGKLTSLTPYHGTDKVYVGNGALLDISHIGTASIPLGNKSLKLKNVLVVPEIKKDLLSISQLTSEYPYTVEFSSSGFVIKDRNTRTVIASGNRTFARGRVGLVARVATVCRLELRATKRPALVIIP
ncbi:hypothetical protein RD792_012318 [Penstemon davidsonii]|uniref:Retrotransposon Copia-like N-terminal domain-containing protein n=1 Tax=Penstemon davidsonii TaxID=160366 RepID=A0ABR0CWY0_9LAMI|nr:hypothetical protein RD792_012318 [Penstemon davidsonii]